MAKRPRIPHEEIVDYINSGKTTQDAKEHFGFPNDNVANLRVYAAFKQLGLPRPRYSERRTCEFCGQEYFARDRKQRTCGSNACQVSLIAKWQSDNPTSKTAALAKYRGTEKGRQNSLRMHRKRRNAGLNGSVVERWDFGLMEATKGLRKLKSLDTRNPWEYRITHIQKLYGLHRIHTPRSLRSFPLDVKPQESWWLALRAVQTLLRQRSTASVEHAWENAVAKISGSIRSGNKVRTWNKKLEIQ